MSAKALIAYLGLMVAFTVSGAIASHSEGLARFILGGFMGGGGYLYVKHFFWNRG